MPAIPASWMPDAKIKGIVVHWTAGNHKANATDREHYHILIEGDGKLVRGDPEIDLNSLPKVKPGYAAHTLNCNTGFIGVSLCCMAGAVESPFKPGTAPMTRMQFEMLGPVVLELCQRYNIKVTPQTVLTHAEVQANLGIPQRQKWDITRLAFDPAIKGARKIGDMIRKTVSDRL
jgi:N-acetyl-anhydromuramyl-L-alanine amidase AmpD